MHTLKPRPPFQVLVMLEESRLGREAIETNYALFDAEPAVIRSHSPFTKPGQLHDIPDRSHLSYTAREPATAAVDGYETAQARSRCPPRHHSTVPGLRQSARKEQRWGMGKAERPGGLQVDDQLQSRDRIAQPPYEEPMPQHPARHRAPNAQARRTGRVESA
jgi:hypothetical protein